jgi:NADH-quinone oxidoreductase subunit A
MTELVFYLAVFVGLGAFFLFIHLVMGSFIRPRSPEVDKLTIYECGEPTIGSAWIQFDLRYYVIALLFVVFDVEVAFFFPWAIVFGKANTLADPSLTVQQRLDNSKDLRLPPLPGEPSKAPALVDVETAHQLSVVALLDILVFFGVLLVGFAYLWKRGDLDWVRSTTAERLPADYLAGPPVEAQELVAAGRGP